MKLIEKIVIPQDNVNDEVVVIQNLYYKNNDKIEKNDVLIDYETSKANFEIISNNSGFIKYSCIQDEEIKVGAVVAEIWSEKLNKSDLKKEFVISNEDLKPTFTKKAEKKIKKLGLKKSLFKNEKLVTEKLVNTITNKNLEKDKNIITRKLSRSKIAEISQLNDLERSPLVSVVSKRIDTKTLELESYYTNKEFYKSIGPMLIKTCSDLLNKEDYKHLNGYYENESVILYESINFGVALNLGQGLKIGVIKDSNNKSLNKIEKDYIDLIDKYIDGKLAYNDISGSTVILTDLTENALEYFIPLLVKKTSIMLGLSGYKGGFQNITIAFDHRVTDGLEVSKFLNDTIKIMKKEYKNIIDEKSCYKCLITLDENKDLYENGFIAVVNSDGENKLICKNCLDGY
jgi:pyruvate dehydrogenase E2 component (dihydrolipoamide acetyltransferase)